MNIDFKILLARTFSKRLNLGIEIDASKVMNLVFYKLKLKMYLFYRLFISL